MDTQENIITPENNDNNKRNLTKVIIVIGLILFVIATIFITTLLNNSQDNPENTVTQYMTALSEGDSETIEQITQYDTNDLVIMNAFEKSEQHITNIKIVEINTDKKTSNVKVSYNLSDETFTNTVGVIKTDKGWLVNEPILIPLKVILFTQYSVVNVNGVETDFDNNNILVPPAEYYITNDSLEYFTVEPLNLILGEKTNSDDKQNMVKMVSTPTENFYTQVQSDLEAHISECVEVSSIESTTECNLPLFLNPNYQSIISVERTIVKYPQIVLSTSNDGYYIFDTIEGVIKMSVNAVDINGMTVTDEFESVVWDYTFSVTVGADETLTYEY